MKHKLLIAMTLMLAGRAMTLAFLGDVGSGGGAPPNAWMMPLIGDAVIGLTALPIAYLVWKRRGIWGWTAAVVWNAVAIWDALAAFIVHLTVPWPEFFMMQIFGSSMFFAASAMHVGCLYLLAELRGGFFDDRAAALANPTVTA